MLDKIFGWKRKKAEPEPDIHFGRYSDNNKTVEKVSRWNDADNFYRDKKNYESIDAFFDYLRDDAAQNVAHERSHDEGRFSLYQGSKIVRGSYNAEHFYAEVALAKMPLPSVPVMRRLLEMNFNLYYTRYALSDDRLCMRFETEVRATNPGKLYYGLKELATKADKQDDLLVQDFTSLEETDTGHITEIPAEEKEIKYNYLQKWINDVLEIISTLDAEKFSGSIAYLLLSLLYRIDYLINPQGMLLNETEKIVEIYFRKDERSVVEKNRDMIDSVKKLQQKTKEEIFPYLFRSKYTFSIVLPQAYKTITEAISNANQNVAWYRDNNYPFIAAQISEYGISYCQFSYSLPKPVTEFYHLLMMISYSDYFAALGFKQQYYNAANNAFDEDEIAERINEIVESWKPKYPNLNFKTEKLRFNNLTEFIFSYTTELESLNIER